MRISQNRADMTCRYPLASFFALSYGISWLIWAPLWLPALGIHGLPMLPFQHALGALGPIAAAFLVSAMEGGAAGPRDLLRRMVLWRGCLPWVAVALLLPYLLLVLAVEVESVLNDVSVPWTLIGASREFPQFSALGFLAYNIVSSILVVALFHAAVDVAFTSSASSPFVTNATGALITFWGIAVIVVAGPRYLSRSGKVVTFSHHGAVGRFVGRDAPAAPPVA